MRHIFKFNNKATRTTPLSLLLTLNIFHTLFVLVFLLLTLNMPAVQVVFTSFLTIYNKFRNSKNFQDVWAERCEQFYGFQIFFHSSLAHFNRVHISYRHQLFGLQRITINQKLIQITEKTLKNSCLLPNQCNSRIILRTSVAIFKIINLIVPSKQKTISEFHLSFSKRKYKKKSLFIIAHVVRSRLVKSKPKNSRYFQ